MVKPDTAVEGAPARPPELVERLARMKYVPVAPGGKWPDIGQQGGVDGSDADQSLVANAEKPEKK